MRRLSSPWTWWHKKAFPRFWFGFLAVLTLLWIPGILRQQVPPATILILIFMVGFGFVLMWGLRIFSLADEVWLDGDQIVVRNGGVEDRFSLANILTVWASRWTNPERIELTLGEPCRFGDEVVFVPPQRWLHFTRHPLASELTSLVEEARGRC